MGTLSRSQPKAALIIGNMRAQNAGLVGAPLLKISKSLGICMGPHLPLDPYVGPPKHGPQMSMGHIEEA